MTELCDFADNLVLEFKENTDLRRNIWVYTTEEKDSFRILRGISAKNQCGHTQLGATKQDLKTLWIDAVINGYVCVLNKVFPRGVKDCLPPPKALNIVVNGDIPVENDEEQKIRVIYEGLQETGIIDDDMPIV